MANSDFIFNLAFRTEGSEEIKQVQASLETLLSSQQRITATSRQQGTAQKSLTTENRNLAQAVQAAAKLLDRQRKTVKLGSKEYVANNQAAAALRNSLNSLNTTNERYNSTVIGQQKREQARADKILRSADASKKLEQETKSLISSFGQSTSFTERQIDSKDKLVNRIDREIRQVQKLQKQAFLTTKQQTQLLREEQRLIASKDKLNSRTSQAINRFEEFKRTAAMVSSEYKSLSADNLRAGETTEEHTREQQRLEAVLEQLRREFLSLSESTELSTQQLAQMNQMLASTKTQALQADRNLRGMSQAFTGQTKSISSANQFLLSFGDIAQDSAQFQFGFSQGMRAIGNNIAFAGEQFTIFQQKVAATNKGVFTMRSGLAVLRGALMGPAGILIAVNLAITAVTVLTSVFGKNKKSADELSATQKALSNAVKEHADAVRELRIESRLLTKEQAESKEGQVELSKARLENAEILKDSILSQRDFDAERRNVTEGMRQQVEVLRDINFQQQVERTGSEAYAERRTLILQSIAADKMRFDLISQINREEGAFNKENKKLLKELNEEIEKERENIEKLQKEQEFLSTIEEEKLRRDKERLFITGRINAEQFQSITANRIYAMTQGTVIAQEEEITEQLDHRIKQLDDLKQKVFEFNTQISLSDGIAGLDLTDQATFDAEKQLIESVFAVRRASQLAQLDALEADASVISSVIAMVNAQEQQAIANLIDARGKQIDAELKSEESAQKSREERDLRAFQQRELLRAKGIENEVIRFATLRDLQLAHLETMDLTENEFLLERARINTEYEKNMQELREAGVERIKKLNQEVVESSKAVNEQLITSLQSSMTGIFGQNKAVALLTLAVEKGLAIGRVLSDARAKASELQTEAQVMSSRAAISLVTGNPAAAGQFASAAALATAGAESAKATGRKNAAKIAAIGLLQGAAALSGGGGGSSAGGGGGSSAGTSFGQSSEELSDRERIFGPRYLPMSERSRAQTYVVVQPTLKDDGTLSVGVKNSTDRLDQSIISGRDSIIPVS